jgi:uncharacterized protein (TIGR02453 family)
MADTRTATPTFDGFPAEAFAWFAGLEQDNSRAWFTAHRETYEQAVRGPLEDLLEELAGELGGAVRMFRQNRDVRFSADKSPYKTTTYGLIVDRPDRLPSLYAQVSSYGMYAGAGYHMMAADQLGRFREAIVEETSGAELERLVAAAEDAGIETFGASLKTAPRGYARDHQRVGLLRHKALGAGRRMNPGADGISRAAALDHARTTWAGCAGLTAWLDAHVGPSDAPEPAGRGRRSR